ncbi:hypothetical protein EGH21_22250 [Halomicroarcula sp. F13]|uniref:Uncharacterized protein n=1 Tax=Haloarcula rubra TaxID=2487747 RepID=A0AAW4PX68_9EURY|nr:hypothetical protein [Halomicroarcula rubra]MBX0325742.1 hypothetical protein [Halomicroarcula rubra]
MSNHKRKARDAVVGLLIALAPFAYKQVLLGNRVVGVLTAVVMALLVFVYRYADAQVIETARDVADADNDGAVADDLQPVLRRVGRQVKRRLPSRDS